MKFFRSFFSECKNFMYQNKREKEDSSYQISLWDFLCYHFDLRIAIYLPLCSELTHCSFSTKSVHEFTIILLYSDIYIYIYTCTKQTLSRGKREQKINISYHGWELSIYFVHYCIHWIILLITLTTLFSGVIIIFRIRKS